MLSVHNLKKSYFDKPVLKDLSFDLNPGEWVSVIGPSGSGKTTLLRILSGLEQPDEGSVWINGSLVGDHKVNLEPHKRSIGVVFQNAALWPHLTVSENIRFGILDLPKPEQEQRITHLLSAIGLIKFGKRYPFRLSGGEARRVALARALAVQPDWLLLDEPLTNLDADLKNEMLALIVDMVPNNTGVVYITHNAEELSGINCKFLILPDETFVGGLP